jgi:hypothetical protein
MEADVGLLKARAVQEAQLLGSLTAEKLSSLRNGFDIKDGKLNKTNFVSAAINALSLSADTATLMLLSSLFDSVNIHSKQVAIHFKIRRVNLIPFSNTI